MMSAKSFISNPDKTDATIVLTMPLRQWKEVRDALENNRESGPWQVNHMISALVTKMENVFYENADEGET